MAQLKEMRSGLQSVRTSVGLQKDALQRQKDALAASRSSQRRLELEVMALEQPWLGNAGEVQCVTDSRCTNYIDAGDKSLGAASSVAACPHGLSGATPDGGCRAHRYSLIAPWRHRQPSGLARGRDRQAPPWPPETPVYGLS